MGQTWHKNIIESKTEADKEKETDEELCYVFLTAVWDGKSHHEVATREDRSGHQAMTAWKKWFSGNEAQQNTIDSILEELQSLKLD